jgi:arsenate reductase
MNTLYGIPNCDTVKKARKWLEQHDVDYQFHDVRKDGLTKSHLNRWLEHVDLETLVNKRSTTWKQLPEDQKAGLGKKSTLSLLIENPTLVKRPVIDTGSSCQVGFKPDSYSDLFNH